MGEFSADWLTLREPADRRGRDVGLAREVIDHVVTGRSDPARPVRLLDLGTGTGSNVRWLSPLVPAGQHWHLVDRDVDLLKQLPRFLAAWALDRGAVVSGGAGAFVARGPSMACSFETHAANLAKLADDAALAALFDGSELVTASALLDLVSERWLEALVERCRHTGAAVLFALTYDGRMTCVPDDPDDEWVRALVNRHQQSVKGFGRALGPGATACATRLFAAAGYRVRSAPSDWQLSSSDTALQRSLIEGWADASLEIVRGDGARVEGWRARRLAHVEAGVSQLTVGHLDLAGWPA